MNKNLILKSLTKFLNFFFLIVGVNNKSAQVLLLLVIPGHLIFLYTIHLMKSGHTSLTPIFIAVYLFAALLQVRISTTGKYLSKIKFLKKKKIFLVSEISWMVQEGVVW